MTPKELLTTIQLSSNHFVENNYEHLKMMRKKYSSDDNFKFTERLFDSLPTDYQNSHFYKLIENSFQILDENIRNKNIVYGNQVIHCKPLPLFGTANFEEFNAFVTSADKSTVIVFNEGLLMFTEKLMEIYTKERWLRKKDKMTAHFQELFTKNFIDIMLCFYIYLFPYHARSLEFCGIEDLGEWFSIENVENYVPPFGDEFLEEDYIYFANQVRTSTYLWFAAHEYSHIALGHLEIKNSTLKSNFSNTELERICISQQHELDADTLATIITMESNNSEVTSEGICLALNTLLLATVDQRPSVYSSHPPVGVRIDNILKNPIINNKYIINNYHEVEEIFSDKYKAFHNILKQFNENNIEFSSIIEMQRYIYD